MKKEESRLEKLENVRHELICDLDEIESREADARQKAEAAEKRAAEIERIHRKKKREFIRSKIKEEKLARYKESSREKKK